MMVGTKFLLVLGMGVLVVSSSARAQDPVLVEQVPVIVEQVASSLNSSCNFSDPLFNERHCIDVAVHWVSVADFYEEGGYEELQVAIGFLVCDRIKQAFDLNPLHFVSRIVREVNGSENNLLKFGCSNAFGDNWAGPPLIFSPA